MYVSVELYCVAMLYINGVEFFPCLSRDTVCVCVCGSGIVCTERVEVTAGNAASSTEPCTCGREVTDPTWRLQN